MRRNPRVNLLAKKAAARAVKTGFIHTQVHVLQACDWKELAFRVGE